MNNNIENWLCENCDNIEIENPSFDEIQKIYSTTMKKINAKKSRHRHFLSSVAIAVICFSLGFGTDYFVESSLMKTAQDTTSSQSTAISKDEFVSMVEEDTEARMTKDAPIGSGSMMRYMSEVINDENGDFVATFNYMGTINMPLAVAMNDMEVFAKSFDYNMEEEVLSITFDKSNFENSPTEFFLNGERVCLNYIG